MKTEKKILEKRTKTKKVGKRRCRKEKKKMEEKKSERNGQRKEKDNLMDLKTYIREVSNYPEEGVSFKDITTLLKDKAAFREVVDQVCAYFKDKGITKIVSLESRGFIVGGAVAYCLDAGFVPARKKGKLPAETVQESYELFLR